MDSNFYTLFTIKMYNILQSFISIIKDQVSDSLDFYNERIDSNINNDAASMEAQAQQKNGKDTSGMKSCRMFLRCD